MVKKSQTPKIQLPLLKFGPLTINGYLTITAIVFAALLGMLFNKVILLENQLKTQVQQVAAQPTTQPAPTEDSGPKSVSSDDDPVLGDKNAKVTMIEFSDYECPFCKRHFDETYSQIKTNYIDKGLLKIVYRDLPLSFHQNAHKEAEAAECVRELSDDATYFKFHDAIFTRTTSNGLGFALTQLAPLASEIGVDGVAVQNCIDSGKFTAEVDKDIASANAAGATGTPTFFIGKSTSNGTIRGTKLVGAQPYDAFKTLIDQQLK